MPDHDALYHRLFSHPGMVAQLLREFVAEPWVDDLDLDTMARLNGDFIAETGARWAADVIWRIRRKREGDAYLLLMLEFQSWQDHWMALRVMVYIGLLWQHLIESKALAPERRLPPVFLVVLYNGESCWRVPETLDRRIALPPDSALWPWQPAARYHVIDEGCFPDAMLADRDTLAGLLFRLENSDGSSQFESIVDAVIDWFRRHDGFDALRPVFATIAARIIWTVEGRQLDERVVEDLLEVKTMLANLPERWKRQWTEEVRQEGRQEGIREGEADALLRLLEHRFGPVPGTIRQRIDAADLPALRGWSIRVLDAVNMDDVLR